MTTLPTDRENSNWADEIDWCMMLRLIPRFDFWKALETIIYGECLAALENEVVDEYLAGRERRQREV